MATKKNKIKTTSNKKTPKKTEFKIDREKLKQPVSSVDTNSVRFTTLDKERKRIYSERSRLVKKLSQATKKVDIKAIRSRIRRTTYFLNQVKRRKRTFKPLRGFEKQIENVSNTVSIKHVYKWEARNEADEILNGLLIKKFIVNYQQYSRRQASLILADIDDLETECDLLGIYYMDFTIDLKTKTLTIERGN